MHGGGDSSSNFKKQKSIQYLIDELIEFELVFPDLLLDNGMWWNEQIENLSSLNMVHAKKSINILYRTCNNIWRMSGDKATDFSFYTKRISLAAVYTSTLLFWLNDPSTDEENTEYFLDRRLNDISKISKLKKPFNVLKNLSSNLKKTTDTVKIKSVFDIIKKLNQIKNSSFSKPF